MTYNIELGGSETVILLKKIQKKKKLIYEFRFVKEEEPSEN